MADVKVELNLHGLNQLMKSPEIGEAVTSAAGYVKGIAKRMSGENFRQSRFRKINWIGVASIYPADEKAAQKEMDSNILLKSIGHAGLPTRKGG